MSRKFVNIVFWLGLILADVAGFLSPKPYLGLILLAVMFALYFLAVFGPRFFLKFSNPVLSRDDIDGILKGYNIHCLARDLFSRPLSPLGFFLEHHFPPKKKTDAK
jgi:hypothetical protein